MNKGKFYLLCVLSLVSATTFAAKERSVKVQNSVRVGYDDNVYQSSNKEGSAFITDIVNLTGKLNFSSRTDMILYWQPEFRYRFEADPEFVSYQDLYGRLNHAVSQRTFLQVSDRFRYQDKDGQTSGLTGVKGISQSYLENDLMGALDFTVNSLSQVKVGGGYELRRWDESSYGKWNPTAKTGGNDFDQFRADGSYIRELRPNTTQGMVGLNYVNHEYDGSRGGFDSTTIYGGADHNFNPNVIGNARLGYTFSNVDNASKSTDNSSPYAQAGLEINPTARTSFNGTLGYSLAYSENSFYNAQDRFNFGVGVRHDLTGKISVSSTLSYIYSYYDADFVSSGAAAKDAKDNYFQFSLRGSYQINRNNFVDAGYSFSDRSTDSAFLQEYDRNRVDIGWRLRL
jgi:hypothetical protein